jgi:GT2 family glycosyltransferase
VAGHGLKGEDAHRSAAAREVKLPQVGKDAPDVSVVIVSFNTREMTTRAVQALLHSKIARRLQIIVVDNASQDGTAKHLQKDFPDITVIESPNEGFAAGNNKGFESSLGKYFLILNPDTEVREDTIASCLSYLECHADVGALGCRVVHPNGDLDQTIFRFPSLAQVFFNIFFSHGIMEKSKLFGDPRYSSLRRDEVHDVDVIAGCYMLVRREVIEQIGGMDERFFVYSEEVEWCRRIRDAGWKIRYFPYAEVLHHGGGSTQGLSEWVAIEVAKGQLLYFRITSGALTARIAASMMVLRDALRLSAMALPSVFDKAARKRAKVTLGRFRFLVKSLSNLPEGQISSRTRET